VDFDVSQRNMKTIIRNLFIVLVSLHSAQAEVQQEVESLVAELPAYATTSPNRFMEIPERGPVKELLDLGIDAVPFLVPHLSNLAMTQSFRVHGSGRKEQISVNEFVGHVITRSCGHYFYMASGERVLEHLGDKPIKNLETIALYQEQVKKWFHHYGRWDESERRLVDVEDWFHYNRFNAYRFFAKNPSPKGRQRLRARIQTLLTEPGYNSTIASELVSCSEAIASMGDVSDLNLVKQAWSNEYERPMHTSGREDKVKRLYQSRVKLGDQQQAKKDIDAYNSKYSGRFPPIEVE
jgi:hypothetical protein